MSNAADAMPGGGVVSVQCQPVTDPAPGVLLTVSDTGVGMGPDVRARAFERFFSTKALPQVGRLVADHGGTVRLHSTAGEGTTAEIWFPRR